MKYISANNNMSSKINILWFSYECQTCIALIKLLRNVGLINHFKLQCLDIQKGLRPPYIPPYIKTVPTIFVTTENKLFVGQETFGWVNKMKFLTQNFVRNINNNIKQQQINNMQNTGLFGWDANIMNKFSDSFTSLDESNSAYSQNYHKLGNKTSIFTAPRSRTISKAEQKKEMEKLNRESKFHDQQYRAENNYIFIILYKDSQI